MHSRVSVTGTYHDNLPPLHITEYVQKGRVVGDVTMKAGWRHFLKVQLDKNIVIVEIIS